MKGPGAVVLVGAGHAHLYVARRAGDFARAGIQLVLIDPGNFWYSGVATGMLGGMYELELDQIDPKALIELCGGHFIRERVAGIDTVGHVVRLESGGRLDYQAVSFNIGSETALQGLALSKHGWTVKPIPNLCRLRRHLEHSFRHKARSLRVIVIGGGPTGCEIAANIDALARRHHASVNITLLTRGVRLLSHQPTGAASGLLHTLRERGIEVQLSCLVKQVEPGSVSTSTGDKINYDLLVFATGLRPPSWLGEWGLPVDIEDGLRVNKFLQVIGNEELFGAGDCIALDGHELPKLGVFGVREAPILAHNLFAAVTGKPLKAYRPQKRYLAILNLGLGQGLATWGPFYWQGHASLWLKDRIDRRFLMQYRPAR